jgi:Flp pilus assembly protein TadD
MALEAVNKGLAIDPEDSWVHETLGFVHLRSGRFDEAEQAFDKVLELNPNDADSIAWAAQAFCRLGRSREAVDLIRKAMRLNPLHPYSYLRTLGHALYMTGDYEGAATALKQGSNAARGSWQGWQQLFLPAAYAQLNRFGEAATEMTTYLTRQRSELGEHAAGALKQDDMSLVMPIVNQHRDEADREHLLDGLLKTGALT